MCIDYIYYFQCQCYNKTIKGAECEIPCRTIKILDRQSDKYCEKHSELEKNERIGYIIFRNRLYKTMEEKNIKKGKKRV